MDPKDKIINMQLELIRSMTERNMRSVGSDLFSSCMPGNASTEKKPDAAKVSDSPTQKDTGGDIPTEETPEEKPPEKIEDLRAELESYIGLGAVKKEVENLINMATVYKKRLDCGLPTVDMSLHMVFSGNPGTGKTTIARFMARVYHSLGILKTGQLVEVDRSGLVAGFVGQTALKTTKVVDSAKGGVLFIDEAYTLTSKGDNDFGYEAVDTILKAMEDNRENLVVIVAGYTELMEEFIDSNPGLQSRFNRYLHFDDYTADEMTKIFLSMCEKNFYLPEDAAKAEMADYLKAVAESAGEFGNARGVRNMFEKILTAQANRLAALSEITRDELMKITADDVKNAEEAR